jgi:hypothetical protein
MTRPSTHRAPSRVAESIDDAMARLRADPATWEPLLVAAEILNGLADGVGIDHDTMWPAGRLLADRLLKHNIPIADARPMREIMEERNKDNE